MMYLSVRPAGALPAPPPPSVIDAGAGADRSAIVKGFTPANVAAAPVAPARAEGRRWRLRVAVPAVPGLQGLLAAMGLGRGRKNPYQGPATREELSRLFARELTDFAQARPKRRR